MLQQQAGTVQFVSLSASHLPRCDIWHECLMSLYHLQPASLIADASKSAMLEHFMLTLQPFCSVFLLTKILP